MKYVLDTIAVILFLNQRNATLIRQMKSTPPSRVATCSVVYAELAYGASKSQKPAQARARFLDFLSQFPSFPFDNAAAEHYGQIRAFLERQGKLIGPNDLLIAAICLANQCTLVTGNAAEFRHVPGLLWEDWQSPADPGAAESHLRRDSVDFSRNWLSERLSLWKNVPPVP